MVPPSTTVQVLFNEDVQAGTGNINVGGTTVDVTSCCFVGNQMTCTPANLALDTAYSVNYAADAIKDLTGNTAANIIDGSTNTMVFNTINIDYTPTAAATVTGVPVVPLASERNIPIGTALELSFTAAVTKGTGTITFSGAGCTVTQRTVDVTSSSVYVSGTSVYIAPGVLSHSCWYTVNVASACFSTATVASFSFETAIHDATTPSVQLYQPKHDTTTENQPVSVDVTLYFSEAVQAVATKHVTVSDGTVTDAIPVDNTNPSMGSVTILGPGSIVMVNPFDDMGYSKTVTVTSDSGAFNDYFGNAFAGISGTSYQFRTVTILGVR